MTENEEMQKQQSQGQVENKQYINHYVKHLKGKDYLMNTITRSNFMCFMIDRF